MSIIHEDGGIMLWDKYFDSGSRREGRITRWRPGGFARRGYYYAAFPQRSSRDGSDSGVDETQDKSAGCRIDYESSQLY
jgi:hypothetical protein